MSIKPDYSFVIPVYNRPQEIKELLQTFRKLEGDFHFEIIIVEDGSSLNCKQIVDENRGELNIIYHQKANSGPGPSRNEGAKLATGDWLIFLDSDVLLPHQYLNSVTDFLNSNKNLKAFGGPDKSHFSFTSIQKSIDFSMTSFFTTGGIRGSKKSVEKFKPRSFNLGIQKDAFIKLKGFSNLRFGEDIDFSLRVEEAGMKTALIEGAFVYHKRRSNFKQFYRQVFNSGIARIVLNTLHPGSLKIVHTFPTLFVLGNIVFLLMCMLTRNYVLLLLLLTFPMIFFLDSIRIYRNLKVAFLAIIASYTQLFGYGLGFLKAFLDRYIFRKSLKYAYLENFYD